MSQRYQEYIKDPINLLEPDRTTYILPSSLSALFPFLDSHIDDFTIQFQNKRGTEVEKVREGIEITNKQFWEVFKMLKEQSELKYFTFTKSISGQWYLIDSRKKKY